MRGYIPTWQSRLNSEVINKAAELAWIDLLPQEQELLIPLQHDLVERFRGLGAKGGREVLAAVGLLMAQKRIRDAAV